MSTSIPRSIMEDNNRVCAVSLNDFLQLVESHTRKWGNNIHRRRIHRVSQQLRQKGQDQSVYDPVMVSLGPYHHGKPELQRAEEFKYMCLNWCASNEKERKTLFFNKILEKIKEIRDCYADASILDQYDDNTLAFMMLLDGCFILNFMEIQTKKPNNFLEWRNCLGVAGAIPFAVRDIVVFENQIPFLVIKLLIDLKYEAREEGQELLIKFLGWVLLVEKSQAQIPHQDEDPPLHILEACWRVVTKKQFNKLDLSTVEQHNNFTSQTTKQPVDFNPFLDEQCNNSYSNATERHIEFEYPPPPRQFNIEFEYPPPRPPPRQCNIEFEYPPPRQCNNPNSNITENMMKSRNFTPSLWTPIQLRSQYNSTANANLLDRYNALNLAHHACRSVMDLKAKGIFFSPSSSHSVKDVSFKSHVIYGHLQLPVRYVSDQTQVLLSNMIAYEISPDTRNDLAVLSYTNFMKSLIQNPDDVKELQEKGILLNRFGNHEQVVKLFKDIDTFGLLNFDIFSDVKERIEEHCSTKAKTWIADLIHTRFRSPWTVMALFAAIFLLCLAFLQTFFTINPTKH